MQRGFVRALPIVICAGLLLAAGQAQQPKSGSPYKEANLWTLGVYMGPSPLQLAPQANVHNPILRGSDVNDLNVDTLAHPFMLVEGSRYYVFFTAKDHASDKGGIGMAESDNGRVWHYRHIVVKEPFVLAHPFVFKWRNDYYMIPEAHTETTLRLYKATAFPDKWEFQKNLMTGDHFISPTLVRYKNMWWMFVCVEGNKTSRLFYAEDFMGPWTEHPKSPIVKDDLHTARPAGRPFVVDGKLYRLGQDCLPTYGYQVHAFEITELTTKTYAEKMVEKPVVKATGSGWNSDAMHHVDAHELRPNQWIAVVDALGR